MNMGDIRPMLIGGGRYIQAEDALLLAGAEIAFVGKRAFIIGGHNALSVVSCKLEEGLRDAGVEFRIEEFKGYCTARQVERYANQASAFSADIIVGVGGGKSIDTAKAVSSQLKIGVITIPTSAATCASYATLSVMYTDDGRVLGNMYHDKEMMAVIVDTNVISQKCPARMLASGVGDALAKYPEILFTSRYFADENESIFTRAALELSRFSVGILTNRGVNAFHDVSMKKNTKAVDDIICTNIAITGQISGLVRGTKQLAVAHSFYGAICDGFKDQQKAFLHGELVSIGILLQMYVNGSSQNEIDLMRAFMRSIGIPASLRDIGIEPSARNRDCIAEFIIRDVDIHEDGIKRKIRCGMDIL